MKRTRQGRHNGKMEREKPGGDSVTAWVGSCSSQGVRNTQPMHMAFGERGSAQLLPPLSPTNTPAAHRVNTAHLDHVHGMLALPGGDIVQMQQPVAGCCED